MLTKYNNKNEFDTLEYIRELLIGELEAITSYSNHILQSTNKELNDVLQDILGDEKRHAKTLLGILRSNDKVQGEEFLKADAVDSNIKDNSVPYVTPEYNVYNSLRAEMQSELYAINSYSKDISKIKNMEINKKLTAILNEEKEHLEQLNKVLNDIDKETKY